MSKIVLGSLSDIRAKLYLWTHERELGRTVDARPLPKGAGVQLSGQRMLRDGGLIRLRAGPLRGEPGLRRARTLPRGQGDEADDLVVAPGFSCRHQIADFCDNRRSLHTAELLAMAG